ncbi:MAG TPA: filamentous hemagglutinin N-terminal domain-containing protein [Noviherbaspirillum sp.]
MKNDSTRGHLDARRPAEFRRRVLPVLVAACFSGNAVANPFGAQVVNGQANISAQGNVLSVTNTPGTIINWQGFSINPGETTRFIQQNANSAVLNRITGQDPSQILGALQSNGRVFLINPNGILFGQGAQVDVNGFVASTLNISNEDFLNGRMFFNAGDRAGNIQNQGAITTPGGGKVYLIAPNVENSGIITSPRGEVLLAAGRSVQLVDSMNPDLHVVISAPENEALNLGQVIAQGGKTGIYGALVRQRGIVNANSAVVGENGKVVLKASRDTMLEAGSRTTATGTGAGGEIHVLGNRVGLTGDAQVDASGRNGGGTVLIGGDYQGRNSQVPNAERTYVGPDAQIRVDATETGNGGKAIVWADDVTRMRGTISARGGQTQGDGGFVETSGHFLDVNGARVDASSSNGKHGTWLLDPIDINIVSTGPAIYTDVDQFVDAGSASVDPATLNGAGANVVVQAQNDLTVSSAVNLAATPNANLTLQAGRSINVNAALQTNGSGNITLVANNVDNSETDAAGGALTGSTGTNRTAGAAAINIGGAISTASGHIKIVNSGATVSGGEPGTVSVAAGLSTTGNVSVAGTGVTFDAVGDVAGNNITVNGRTGTISASAAVALLQATAGSTVTLQADNVNPANFSISTGPNGLIKLYPYSSGRRIDVGTAFAVADCLGESCLKFTWAELANAIGSAGTVVIGDPTVTGNLYITGSIATNRSLGLEASGSIHWNVAQTLDFNGGGTSGNSLKVEAGTDIFFNGTVDDSDTGTSDLLHVSLNAATSGTGRISATNGVIRTYDGNITLGGGANPLTSPAISGSDGSAGVFLSDTELNAAAGSITIRGQGFNNGTAGNHGVSIIGTASGLSKLQTTTGTISIYGQGGSNASAANNAGVYMYGNSFGSNKVSIQSDSGAISVTGTGGTSASSGGDGAGIFISSGALVKNTSGAITLDGVAGNGFSGNTGITLWEQNPVIESDTGAVNLTGTGTVGIDLIYGASVLASGATKSANITLDGTATAGGSHGIRVHRNSSPNITTIGGTGATGNIVLRAGGDAADTIAIADSEIKSSGTLYLEPGGTTDSVGVAGGTGKFNIDNTDLASIQSGFNFITIGNATTAGAISLGGPWSPTSNVILQSPGAGSGGISIGADLTGAATKTIKLSSAGPVTQSAMITADDLLLAGGGSFTLTNTNNAVSALSTAGTVGSIQFAQKGDLSLGSTATSSGLGISLTDPDSLLSMQAAAAISGSNIALSADRFSATTGSITASGGTIWFKPSTQVPPNTPRPILIGGTNDASTNLELSAAELNLVDVGTSGILAIGDIPAATASSTGAIDISQATALTAAKVTSLALITPYGVTQTPGQALNVERLAVVAQQTVDLDDATNQIAKTTAMVGKSGDASRENQNFSLKSGSALNVDALDMSPLGSYGTISGISIAGDASSFDSAAPNTVISLTSTGALTQSAGALLSGKAVYAEGSRVALTQTNPTGVIAGRSTGGATGDSFRYTSSNGIYATTVNSFAGIQSASTVDSAGIELNAGASGIGQATDAPITTSQGLVLSTSGSIDLRAGGNSVAAVSASNAGGLQFYNSGAIEVGVAGTGVSTTNQTISVKSGGLLTVRNNVNAGTGNIMLEAPDIQLGAAAGVGPTLAGSIVKLQATDESAGGWITTAGTSATTITSSSGIELEADNMDFSAIGPVFNAANEVSYSTFSDNRAITVGAACNALEPNCLKLNFSGVTNHAPDLVIGNETAAETNTAGNIYVDAALSHPDYVDGATNAPGRVALLTGGGISQTAAITASGLGFLAGTVAGTHAVNLNQANVIGKVAGDAGSGSITLNNAGALQVVQMSGGNPMYSDITTVNGLIADGSISITNSGNVTLDAPVDAGTAAVTITATGTGAINGSGLITGSSLTATAVGGIGHSTALSTTVGMIDVTNSGTTGNISITNSGALTLQGARQTGSGSAGISVVSYGNMSVGTVTSDAGPISLSAYHQMTVSGPVSSATGNISLAAVGTGTPGNGDTLTINGTVSTGSGTISLSAGDDIVISNPANVNAGTGTVSQSPNLNGPVAPPPPPPPTIAECTVNPNLSGCSSVLPSLSSCTADPTQAGCSAVLPSLDTCTTNPTQAGCTAVLPSLDACTANPTLAGCTVVLPSLDTCTSNPTQAGCTAVLPSLATCTIDPTQAGCTAVLPSLATCTIDPTQAGCTAVLPTLATCTANPTQAGCTAVLPSLATCTANPTQAGCTAVLPSLATCTANPTQAGCTAVLPSLATCTTNPTQAGCTAVLPSLATCTIDPTQAGCTVVLPSLASCTTDPTQAGCSAVLPSVAQCIAAPTTPGCTAVPTIISCTANPLLAGCSDVLPTLDACTTNPTQAGCSVVLPTMSTCISNPAQAGCTVVLPTLGSCTVDPAQAGCSAVLPSIDVCTANPTQTGCTVVLPTLSSCTTNPAQAGCSAVLPTLSSCMANQMQPGCTAVLPTVEQCLADSTVAGCSTVITSTSRCLREPTLPECRPVLPPDTPAPPPVAPPTAETSPVVAVENSVIQLTSTTTPIVQSSRQSQPSGTSASSSSSSSSSTASSSNASNTSSQATSSTSSSENTQEEKSEDKKDEKRTTAGPEDSGAQKNEPAKKMYCN